MAAANSKSSSKTANHPSRVGQPSTRVFILWINFCRTPLVYTMDPNARHPPEEVAEGDAEEEAVAVVVVDVADDKMGT